MGGQEADYRKTLSVDSVPLDESGLRELLVCPVIVHFSTSLWSDSHSIGLSNTCSNYRLLKCDWDSNIFCVRYHSLDLF